MSNKEIIIQLLDRVPEYKMGYVLAYVQGITADEKPTIHSAKTCGITIKTIPKPIKMRNLPLKSAKRNGVLTNV